MALSKEKKTQVIDEVAKQLTSARLTVAAYYKGTSVQSMQELRADARRRGATVRVVKNRLFKKALASVEKHKSIDIAGLKGQLLYAFSNSDELSPAQTLADFAKREPQIEFVLGINELGELLSADDVRALAALASKDQLRGQLVSCLAAPLTGLAGVVGGNLAGLNQVLAARAEITEQVS